MTGIWLSFHTEPGHHMKATHKGICCSFNLGRIYKFNFPFKLKIEYIFICLNVYIYKYCVMHMSGWHMQQLIEYNERLFREGEDCGFIYDMLIFILLSRHT